MRINSYGVKHGNKQLWSNTWEQTVMEYYKGTNSYGVIHGNKQLWSDTWEQTVME